MMHEKEKAKAKGRHRGKKHLRKKEDLGRMIETGIGAELVKTKNE